jgi:hypothetical protein
MKSIETQLVEKERELSALRKAANKTTLRLDLSESGLPAAAQTRIQKRFESAESLGDLKKAITEEHEYIRQARKANARSSSARLGELSESHQRSASLVEGYRAMGLSEKEAKLAAGMEDAVEDMKESQERLYNSAKSMGMSDAEAKAFSEPNRSSSW